MIKSFPKHKQVRLHGDKLKKLVETIYERDRGCCVNCHRPIEEGTKPHHVIFKSHGGGDTEDNLVMLCGSCHYAVHHGGNGKNIQDKCKRLLQFLYDNED